MTFTEGSEKSVIQVSNADDRGSDNIVIRFLYDFRSLLLIVTTCLIAFAIWDVSPTIAQFAFGRPFVWGTQVSQRIPNKMPKNLLLSNHHWYFSNLDFYGMFAIGQLYRHFRVLQRMAQDQFAKPVQGASYMYRQGSDAHWTLAMEYMNHTRKNDKEHQFCMTVFPDRDSCSHDTDEVIGYGHGIQALSLAFQIPILDCRLYAPLDDRNRHAVFEYFFLDMPSCEPLKDRSLEGYAQWRNEHKTTIIQQSCQAKKEQLQWKLQNYKNPMCPKAPMAHITKVRFTNENLVDRYRCDFDEI